MGWDNFHGSRAAYRIGWFNVLTELSIMMKSPDKNLYHYSQISLDLQKITTSRPWMLDEHMHSDVKLMREVLLSTNLVEALELSKNCLCEDKRDKFYGVLGLTTNIDYFDVPVDYSLTLFQVYGSVLQNSLGELGTDDEVSPFYDDSDDDELPPYSERHIWTLSRALQRSLLGPAFELSSFEEMASGRAVMLARSTADLKYLKIHGEDLGKVIACSTTLHGLPHQPPEEPISGAVPAIFVLEKKIQSSLTISDSDSDDSWANFCFDLSIGCELGMDESATRSTNSLTMFVTDSGNVGVALDIIMLGDHVWGYESSCPRLAILRGEEGNYRMISRACFAKDWIRPGISAVDSEWVPARNKAIEEMTIGFNLADLQILTCPLRGRKDLEQKLT
ncbi:hypothetical protein BKA64DRAFT_709829 [Cadophora sp. MPI-SDFR-AT-0126]|nr:hypothetical protein BKA64DRAFT_709829 [Leotiomycetes sp. MPI-SDFR-AT-0126]